MKYVLIMMLWGSGGYGYAPAITTAEFGNVSACKFAEDEFNKMRGERNGTAKCVHKGVPIEP